MIIWIIVLAFGGLVVGSTLLVYLYECFPDISSWCSEPVANVRWIRNMVRWLFGLAIYLRTMSVIGCAIIMRCCRWLGSRVPPLKLFTMPIALLFFLCALAMSSRVGIGNDEIATKEWILGEICKLSCFEFYRLADRLKQFSASQFGAYD